jgi:hypothetical protein
MRLAEASFDAAELAESSPAAYNVGLQRPLLPKSLYASPQGIPKHDRGQSDKMSTVAHIQPGPPGGSCLWPIIVRPAPLFQNEYSTVSTPVGESTNTVPALLAPPT